VARERRAATKYEVLGQEVFTMLVALVALSPIKSRIVDVLTYAGLEK